MRKFDGNEYPLIVPLRVHFRDLPKCVSAIQYTWEFVQSRVTQVLERDANGYHIILLAMNAHYPHLVDEWTSRWHVES